MAYPKGKPRPPGSGRKKGTTNKITAKAAELIDEVLFADPETTKRKLIELRDSDDVQDRRIFWQFCGRRVPMAIEAKVETTATVAIVRRYSSGKVIPITGQEIDDDGSEKEIA